MCEMEYYGIHLSPGAKMFSNLRLCKAPRSPPDVRQPVSLFQRKITKAGCQEGGLPPPPPAAGEIISLIIKHLQPRARHLLQGQQRKAKASFFPWLRLRKAEERYMGPARNSFHPSSSFPKDPSTSSPMSPSSPLEQKDQRCRPSSDISEQQFEPGI